jgi:hypothetical protein
MISPTTNEPEQPEAVQALMGRTVTVTPELTGMPRTRPYKLRVTEARMSPAETSGAVWVTGERLRLDGTPARRKVTGTRHVALLDGWTELLGLPSLPPREWTQVVVGLPLYSESQRNGIAAIEVDEHAAYRVSAVLEDGTATGGDTITGSEACRVVAARLGRDGTVLDRHEDGKTLRLRHRHGGNHLVLTPTEVMR